MSDLRCVIVASPFALDEGPENWFRIKFGQQIVENLKSQKLRT